MVFGLIDLFLFNLHSKNLWLQIIRLLWLIKFLLGVSHNKSILIHPLVYLPVCALNSITLPFIQKWKTRLPSSFDY
jgi:hypothetical protein